MLLYGTGVQIEECVDLRVKDLDFDRHQIIVRQGKGRTDRLVDVMWIFTRVDTRESGAYPPDPRSSGVGWKCGLRKRLPGTGSLSVSWDTRQRRRVSTRSGVLGFLLKSPARQWITVMHDGTTRRWLRAASRATNSPAAGFIGTTGRSQSRLRWSSRNDATLWEVLNEPTTRDQHRGVCRACGGDLVRHQHHELRRHSLLPAQPDPPRQRRQAAQSLDLPHWRTERGQGAAGLRSDAAGGGWRVVLHHALEPCDCAGRRNWERTLGLRSAGRTGAPQLSSESRRELLGGWQGKAHRFAIASSATSASSPISRTSRSVPARSRLGAGSALWI